MKEPLGVQRRDTDAVSVPGRVQVVCEGLRDVVGVQERSCVWLPLGTAVRVRVPVAGWDALGDILAVRDTVCALEGVPLRLHDIEQVGVGVRGRVPRAVAVPVGVAVRLGDGGENDSASVADRDGGADEVRVRVSVVAGLRVGGEAVIVWVSVGSRRRLVESVGGECVAVEAETEREWRLALKVELRLEQDGEGEEGVRVAEGKEPDGDREGDGEAVALIVAERVRDREEGEADAVGDQVPLSVWEAVPVAPSDGEKLREDVAVGTRVGEQLRLRTGVAVRVLRGVRDREPLGLSVRLRVGPDVGVPVGVGVVVGVGVWLRVPLGYGVTVTVGLRGTVALVVGLRVGVGEVCVGVAEREALALKERVWESEALRIGCGVRDRVAVAVEAVAVPREAVCERVCAGVAVAEARLVRVRVGAKVGVREGVQEPVGVGPVEPVRVPIAVAVAVAEVETVADSLRDGGAGRLRVADAVRVPNTEAEAEGLWLWVHVADTVRLRLLVEERAGVPVPVVVPRAERVAVGDGGRVAVPLRLRMRLALTVHDPERVGVLQREGLRVHVVVGTGVAVTVTVEEWVLGGLWLPVGVRVPGRDEETEATRDMVAEHAPDRVPVALPDAVSVAVGGPEVVHVEEPLAVRLQDIDGELDAVALLRLRDAGPADRERVMGGVRVREAADDSDMELQVRVGLGVRLREPLGGAVAVRVCDGDGRDLLLVNVQRDVAVAVCVRDRLWVRDPGVTLWLQLRPRLWLRVAVAEPLALREALRLSVGVGGNVRRMVCVTVSLALPEREPLPLPDRSWVRVGLADGGVEV